VRVLYGLEAGRQALTRRPGGQSPLPERVQARIREAFGEDLTAEQVVERILEEVRREGDRALFRLAEQVEGVRLEALEVPREEWYSARRHLPHSLLHALEHSARRVTAFHRRALPADWFDPVEGYGQRFVPLERAGLYIPGGTAVYPSTVLMTALPARVAGVEEVILCTPARPHGGPDPAILAAADLAGVDRVFQVGGAQAIAAMAYGTETIPRVDIVCGPGNIFVALAKRRVMGDVAVDGLYGPTETVLVADETANPRWVAGDLLAQAEHDEMATPILLTPSEALVRRVLREVERQARTLPRREVARQALEANGVAVVVASLEEAVDLANHFAPEHLCLAVQDPWRLLPRVRNAGGVFIGEHTPESVGDYLAGPSHAMPTGGTARWASALGVHHFLKPVPVVALGPRGLEDLALSTMRIARAEGLEGHARAVAMRRARRGGRDGRAR